MSDAKEQYESLPADWRDWPVIPNREGYSTTRHRMPMVFVRRERKTIVGYHGGLDLVISALAEKLNFLGKDSQTRIGKFIASNGPADIPTIRLEYTEDTWTAFVIEFWVSNRMGSLTIVADQWLFEDGSWCGAHVSHTSHLSRALALALSLLVAPFRVSLLVGFPLFLCFWVLMLAQGIERRVGDTVASLINLLIVGAGPLFGLLSLFVSDWVLRAKALPWAFGLYVEREGELKEAAAQRQALFIELVNKALLQTFAQLGIPDHAVT